MRLALVNPDWTFDGSIYFGCRLPHLPLELAYAAALCERAGHEGRLFDAHLQNLAPEELARRVEAFAPDIVVIATAPTYLFWRCPQPELTVPREAARLLAAPGRLLAAVGPHASVTPQAVLRKLPVDVAVLGECEEIVPLLPDGLLHGWDKVPAVARREGERVVLGGPPREADMAALPALSWPGAMVGRHTHHHHRFDVTGVDRPGAELEASRGCPYACTFCAKTHFRGRYRRRPLPTVLMELDGLIAQGIGYVYFVDELFLPDRALLRALARRPVSFGVQTRIDLWEPEELDALGNAGCVSLEAGVESVTQAGRELLGKRCACPDETLLRLLARARRTIPFVQANLLLQEGDDPAEVAAWRRKLLDQGVWANEPVPLFPYPGSAEYVRLFGPVDESAWERAHAYYLARHPRLSDIQSGAPLPLALLEA